MASKSAHLEQAGHNEALRSSIPDTHPDWEITTIFYTALHYLRAHLAGLGARYTGNDLRYDLLSHFLRLEGLSELVRPFDLLRDLSYETRYGCRTMGWNYSQMTDAERALERIKKRLLELGEVN